uniref:ribosomal protein S8 n=1 Tax=Meteora sporadica TaxID=2913902 RepID=UPI0030031BF9|nr:ribosomal protein S8 [Meteora sporadica]WVH37084.1 ribosomal protein S8 [Meteora sporadica]
MEGKYRYSTSLHTYDLYEITKLLKTSGFIKRYDTDGSYITIYLKQNTTTNIIQSIRRVSTPGNNYYCNYKDLSKICKQTNGFYGGIAVLKGSSGILNHRQALQKKEGGILLFIIT